MDKCGCCLSKKKKRPLQETTTGHNAEINRSRGTQPQWIQLYHNFYIFMTLGNIVKEQAERS